ncbi:MAG: tyrosine-type recombinase/integrase [Oligoflexia bacterium]|nr:tyrosine-type recombinase/integrase [Oligoflexia bacterium]MBF0365093.1 tyrosine-type recombinase/integrase [Oligoflexia bacterium]MBF0367721.1 tyrosine-type recombinase/integrase [Oligoflexia bacterium]
MRPNNANNLLILDDFTSKNEKVKSPISETISLVARNVNRHKLSYDQLRFIMKMVREKCQLTHPKTSKKLPEMPRREEIDSFYGNISNPIHRLIFECLEGTGLRIQELCNLRVTDIDFDNNTLFVRQGKGHKDRVAIIGNTIKEKLLIYLDGRNNHYLFESSRHTKYSTRRIQQLCSRYSKSISNRITCHTFRHLFITNLAENNVSREIREIVVGHAKNSKAHDCYLHLSLGGSKEKIINILDKRTSNEK